MAEFWGGFSVTFVVTALLGGLLARFWQSASLRAHQQTNMIVSIAGGMLVAALVGFAFLAEAFAEHGSLPQPRGGLITETQKTGQLYLCSIMALWFALIGVLTPKHSCWSRWVGGCLLVSAAGVLVFLPSVVSLFFEVARASVSTSTS